LDVNYLAVVAAALSSFLLGGVWYSPLLFLKPWNTAMGRAASSASGHPARVFGLSFLFALVSAFVFAVLLGPTPELGPAIQLGVTIGVGFVVMSFGINYQFANRSFAALIIDGGYHVGQFVLFGIILGLWH
jgi:hypothetical protein